jgi:hypothetical protein
VRKLLPSLPFVGVLMMFCACSYQSTCERELIRAQGKGGAACAVHVIDDDDGEEREVLGHCGEHGFDDAVVGGCEVPFELEP